MVKQNPNHQVKTVVDIPPLGLKHPVGVAGFRNHPQKMNIANSNYIKKIIIWGEISIDQSWQRDHFSGFWKILHNVSLRHGIIFIPPAFRQSDVGTHQNIWLVAGLVAIFGIFPLILGMSSSQLTNIFFRGVFPQPPTSNVVKTQ